MGSMILFSIIAASTFFITKVWQVRFPPDPSHYPSSLAESP
jgi:hypothetical protein